MPKPLGFAVIVLLSIAGTVSAQPTPSADPPAEEKYKNIQVFKGVPSSQILPAMFFMRGSLGVSCNECHVNFTDFEKDDNPKKQTARQMIRMVRELNQGKFAGQMAVTCNTCHRGQPKPVAPLAFASIRDKKKEAKPAEASATQAVPAADEIFDRYVAATGGKAALERVSSIEMTGSMLSSEGWTAPLLIDLKGPERVFVTFDLSWPSFQASNAGAGWSQDNHGLHDLAAKRLAQLRRQAAFFQPQRLKDQYLSVTSAGKETIGDREAFVVQGALPDGDSEKLYFDTQTGLLARVSTRTDSILGVLPNEVDVEDYRDAGGVKLPFMIVRQAPDFSSAYKIEHMKLNAAIDDARFEKPAVPLDSILKPKS